MNEPPDQSKPLLAAELRALYSAFILLLVSLSPPAAHSTPLLWIGRSNALDWEWARLNPLHDCAQKIFFKIKWLRPWLWLYNQLYNWKFHTFCLEWHHFYYSNKLISTFEFYLNSEWHWIGNRPDFGLTCLDLGLVCGQMCFLFRL